MDQLRFSQQILFQH